MKIFAIGDLHLSHSLDKPMDLFGDHWSEHSQKIKQNWEKQITHEDIVLIPGDISWAMRLDEAKLDLDWLNRLPGKKICIRGNHDYWWDRPKKLSDAYPQMIFLQNTSYTLNHITFCGTRGWICPNSIHFTPEDERIFARELARLKLSLDAAIKQGATEIWVMLHYPPTYGDDKNSPITELLKSYPIKRVIYGHLHDEVSWKSALKGDYEGIHYQLVSADYLDFSPLLLL